MAVEVDQRLAWPHLSAIAGIFDVDVSTVSRWAKEIAKEGRELGTWVRGELHLRPAEVLLLAERDSRSLHETASAVFAFAREATTDRQTRADVRAEINDYLEDARRRKDPKRVLTLAEVLEELRMLLPAAQYERVRSRLEAQPRPKGADMFSAGSV